MSNLKRAVVWYSMRNGGDGSVSPNWFLTEEHAEKDEESQSEGWGEPCHGSVETYEGSRVHKLAVKNSEEMDSKHEHLKQEDFYETRTVSAGRKEKTCEVCGKTIKIGQPADMHHFYPEFNSYATHPACSDKFMKSLND